jgi:hypothetical protein
MATKFCRIIQEGMDGPDAEAVGRALIRAKCYKMPIRVYNRMPKKWKQRMGPRKMDALMKFKRQKALKNKTKRTYDSYAHYRLLRYFDGKAHDLYRQCKVPPPPPIVKMIEPRQGWNSLVKYFWDDYSIARTKHQMTDLGTYNPASRLPSGGRSDHAYYPAKAMDLGFSPYPNRLAYEYFKSMIGEPEVEYIIYGNQIWSRSSGLRHYGYGGHYNHIHVSGRY